MKHITVFFLFVILAISCNKEEVKKVVLPSKLEKGFYVINEGNFGWGNASLGYVDDSFSYYEHIYEGVNSKKLGDVFQQMYTWGEKHYLVLNNSSKIEVINKETHSSAFTISNLGTPRYMTVAGSNGFVNDLFSDKITVFNLVNGAIIKTISLGATMDRVYRSSDWVIGVANKKVYKIDSRDMELKDSLDFGMQVLDLVSDEDSMVFAIGKGVNDSLFGLHLDPISLEVIGKKYLEFLLAKPNYLRANKKGVYFTQGHNFFRYQFDKTTTTTYAVDAMMQLGNIYGMNVHPISGNFYFCDAKDYTQKGEIIIINQDLEEVQRLKVGVIPNDVVFEYE